MQFILNDKEVSTSLPPATLLLDFIRYHQHLMGTKIGCREGDCGACTVLVGEIKGDELRYRSATSCLTALGNICGKHVVTVEGVNDPATLNLVQQAICDEAATQCGFCTPGLVVSLIGFCLDHKPPTYDSAIAAIDGNICRCTGYKSIERAAGRVAAFMQHRNGTDPITFASQQNLLPQYFSGIAERLRTIPPIERKMVQAEQKFLGGGTDLYVQQHESMNGDPVHFLFDHSDLNGITLQENTCIFGASATVTDLLESGTIREYFPGFSRFAKLISSTPIRNIATIAGNFINASPIGDFTIFFLAMDATLILNDGVSTRKLPLRKLYKGYKHLDKKKDEFIEKIMFEIPGQNSRFHFEKVSKRTHLDIASVNTAIHIKMEENMILGAGLSAGGVAPVPLFLSRTSAFLEGKIPDRELVDQALEIVQQEISPISDARGTAGYKRLLLQQLIRAHFIALFPELEVDLSRPGNGQV